MKIGMLTDFVAVEYCNGPALACQAFRRHMENRGHHVGLIGPKPNKEQQKVKQSCSTPGVFVSTAMHHLRCLGR